MNCIRFDGEDLLLRVFAKPRGNKSRIVGPRGDELEIIVAAPPVDGAANAELCKFLAKVCRYSRSRIRVEKGQSSRHKLVRLEGAAQASVEEVLAQQT